MGGTPYLDLECESDQKIQRASALVVGLTCVKTVLFLCTGNYYRSRFAEELFNHRAACARIDWQAKSRALAIERGINNVGAMSPLVLGGLTARGLSSKGAVRSPAQCIMFDLESADYIIALSELEHRPLMNERFPDWVSRVHYWQIGDVALMEPSKALASIDAQMAVLVATLRERQPAA